MPPSGKSEARKTISRVWLGRVWLSMTTVLLLLALAWGGLAWAPDRDVRIAQAARKNDAATVRSLIKEHPDVNASEGDGSTALLWAAYHSNLEITRLLLAAGADVKVANRLGLTPLLEACRLGNSAIVEALLNAGADPKAVSPGGETVLMAAASAGDVEPVSILLARGADVNAKEPGEYQTALMFAAIEGHIRVVEALLKAGADPNLAAKVASLSRANMGDTGRDWVVHPTGGLTALMFAIREGHADVVKALVEAGAEVNHTTPDGLTPLLMAVINDRLDLAGFLLDKGANANDGSLYEAIQVHNRRVIETNGDATRPRLIHENRLTPLDLIDRLLAHGADPNRVAVHTLFFAGAGGGGSAGLVPAANETPFARALRAQDVAVLRLLLAKGANPNTPTDGVALPLAIAMGAAGQRGGFFGFGTPSPFRFPSERSADAAVKLLLETGADVNSTNAAGDTALLFVAQIGDVAMIRLLADRGEKLDIKDNAGLTALDMAMGKRAPVSDAGRGRGGGGQGRGPAIGPRPQAIALLRELMGMPPLSPAEMPAPPGRGPGPQGGN